LVGKDKRVTFDKIRILFLSDTQMERAVLIAHTNFTRQTGALMKNQSTPTPHALRKLFGHGLLSGALATVAAFLGTRLLGLPYPPEVIFQALIAPVPGSIESFALETFGEYAKYSAFVFAMVVYAVSYGFVAVLAGYVFRFDLRNRSRHVFVLAAALPTVVGIAFEAALSSRASALSSLSGWLVAGVFILAVNLSYAALLVYQATPLSRAIVIEPSQVAGEILGSSFSSRRAFLRKVVVGIVATVLAVVAVRQGLNLLSGQGLGNSTPIPINNESTQIQSGELPSVFRDARITDLVASEITDDRVFYRVDIAPIPPSLNFDAWSLKVGGKVNKPLTLNKESLMKLPTQEQYTTLECVSNTINPPAGLIGNAKWTGVGLAALLDEAVVSPDAKYVVFRCADGYSVGIPLDRAMQPGAMLAYMMGDQSLPQGHGFPLKAIVPGIYGMMNAKWITEIEVVDYVYLGFWQERGWSNDAKIKTTSIIYYPADAAKIDGATPIAGIAFAGDRGISKVEVSVDNGSTWHEAVLKKSISPYSWVLWAYEWTPTTKGTYTIVARAYDGTGRIQSAKTVDPFPDGASGYHRIHVTAA